MRAFLLAIAVALGQLATACSVFTVFDGKLALAGDSEDWFDPNTQLWTIPKTDKLHGVVYLGFGKGEYPAGGIRTTGPKKLPKNGVIGIEPSDAYGFPQAGMNDQGLFFGGAATDMLQDRKGNGKPLFPGFFVHHVLRNCATVPEALAVIRRYDIGMPQGQILLGDRHGASAIVEAGNVIIEKSGRFQIITNFRLSTVESGNVTCARYQKLESILAPSRPLSVDFARDAIAAVSVKPIPDSLAKRQPGTQYSVVFDMTHAVAHLYNRATFERAVAVDVKAETGKAAYVKTLAALFSRQ
ncbi:MAG: hypothetical protein HONBIEJF_00960 [Fimbriimonadaceae bacterium]|nr:hypothetical protein [Fimbriimonadaceae bacterium]